MQPAPYHQTHAFTAQLGGAPVRVVTKSGLSGGHQLGAPTALAAELIAPASGEQVLLLGCGHGALGVALARRLTEGRLTLSDPSLIARRMARLTLAANDCADITVSEQLSLLPEHAGSLDRVVVLAPRSRALGRRWLAEAHALLRPGGILNLAGANHAGIQPLIGDAAALFGAAQSLGYGRGCRVAAARRAEAPPAPPAWTTVPGIAPGSWHSLRAELPDGAVTLVSLPGSFSYEHVDPGTALLLKHFGPVAGLRVLDIGCGYGPIGLAAARLGAAHVTMLDVCLLALAAARENIVRLDLASVRVLASDGLEAVAGQRFDLVLSNPPFHAGRAVDTAMAAAFFAEARAVLAPTGRLLLVANRFLAYERLLAPYFAEVAEVAGDRAYKLVSATQPHAPGGA
jgi:16S rRNA (guanine1207-N2)-methyltransferase